MRKSPSSKGEGRKAVSVQETEQNEGETKKKKKKQSLTQVICTTLGEENRGQSHKFSPANEHLQRTEWGK